MRIKIPHMQEAMLSDPDIRHYLRHYKSEVHEHLGARLIGRYTVEQYRNGELISGFQPETPNLFVTEGLAYLANLAFAQVSKAAAYNVYLGLGRLDITPVAGLQAFTALGPAGSIGEAIQSQGHITAPATNRPTYTTATTTTGVISNLASPASFTIGASWGTSYCYTVFASTAQGQGATTTGTLLSVKRLDPIRTVVQGDVLNITYEITLASS